MTEGLSAGGNFWQPENLDHRVPGVFTAGLGQKPEVTLTANLVPDPRVTVTRDPSGSMTTISYSAEAKRSVASFLATTVHGQLDSGEAVTLLAAQNHGGPGFRPHYYGTAAIVGALVSKDQLYSTVRFRLDHLYWMAHLTGGEASTVEDNGSKLSIEGSDEGNWLVYESSTPATLRQFEIRVISGCLAFLQLAIYPDPAEARVTRETQIRIHPDSPWLAVHGAAFCAEPSDSVHDPLLPREQLTVERFSKWIALHTKLDGLPWVVARQHSDAVQTRILLLAPLFEAFHRWLPEYQQAKFPGVAKSVLKRISKAARQAAGAQATAEGLSPEPIEQATVLFRDVSFQERAAAIVTEVTNAVPEISESVSELPRRITKARNEIAHHLTTDSDKPIEIRALEWLVIANTTAWVLRVLLLLRAGIEPEVLQQRVLRFDRFKFFRANTARHVEELGWELP